MQTAALAPPFAIEHLDWDAPVKEWLVFATENAIVIIDALALIIVVGGTVEAFVGGLRAMFSSPTGHDRRDIWLRYARWLVAGLTFQLAADIIETSISIEWQAVARIGAIAVIRTFLNYFLDRDLAEVRDRQHERSVEYGESPAVRRIDFWRRR
jgi:uncharacterized membrane protein